MADDYDRWGSSRERDWNDRERERGRNRDYGSRMGGYGGGYGGGHGGDDRYGRPSDEARGRDYGAGSYGSRDYGAGSGRDYGSYPGREETPGWAQARPGYGASDYRGDYGRSGYARDARDEDWRNNHRGRNDRGFFDRAADEVSTWFGDEDAERRRRQDALMGDQGAQHHRGRGPRGYRRSDDRIRDDINDRLTDDPYIDASDIDVMVQDGEVTLTGSVVTRDAKRRAEDLAEAVSGARHVQNNLRVGQSGSLSNTTDKSTITGASTTGMTGTSSDMGTMTGTTSGALR